MAQREELYIRGPRRDDPQSRDVAGRGGPDTKLKGSRGKSREGIPYANLGRMTVRAKKRKKGSRSM